MNVTYETVKFSDHAYGVSVSYRGETEQTPAFCETHAEALDWADRLMAGQVLPSTLLQVIDDNMHL